VVIAQRDFLEGAFADPAGRHGHQVGQGQGQPHRQGQVHLAQGPAQHRRLLVPGEIHVIHAKPDQHQQGDGHHEHDGGAQQTGRPRRQRPGQRFDRDMTAHPQGRPRAQEGRPDHHVAGGLFHPRKGMAEGIARDHVHDDQHRHDGHQQDQGPAIDPDHAIVQALEERAGSEIGHGCGFS